MRKEPLKIGLLVSTLGATQLGYHVLEQGNARLGESIDVDLIIFQQNVTKTWTTPTFAMMNVSEAYSFTGAIIATDVDCARKSLRFPGPSSLFFYSWDMEWLRAGRCTYEEHARVYTDERLPLIARSDSHANLLERCWNRRVLAVVPSCDLAGLAKAVLS